MGWGGRQFSQREDRQGVRGFRAHRGFRPSLIQASLRLGYTYPLLTLGLDKPVFHPIHVRLYWYLCFVVWNTFAGVQN